MKALVTGGSGFIGSHLVEALAREGWDVQVVAKHSMYSDEVERVGARLLRADIRDTASIAPALRDADLVFHLAGVTRARCNAAYYSGNHLATRDFLRVCAAHCGALQRFVYVSSLTAVGPRLGDDEVTEYTPYHPVSHYGRSKMLAETEVRRYAEHFPVTIVRPSGVYGPRDREFFRFFSMIQHGIEPLVGSGEQELNIVHVDDLVRGILAAAVHPQAAGETFMLGDAVNYSTARICGAFAEAEACDPFVVKLPAPLVYIAAALSETVGKLLRRDVMFNIQKARETLQDAWTCSIQKARMLLDYEPRVSLAEGAAGTYMWYKMHGWL